MELSSAQLRLGTPEAAIDQLMAATEAIGTRPLTTATRLLGARWRRSGNADRAVEAIGRAMEVVEPEDRELALLLEADRAAYAQQASLDTRARWWPIERHGQLDGSRARRAPGPGEPCLRARQGERVEAVAFIERVLADGRLLGEQAVDVAGTHYLLLVGLLATDALDLAESCAERMLADARARARSRPRRS